MSILPACRAALRPVQHHVWQKPQAHSWSRLDLSSLQERAGCRVCGVPREVGCMRRTLRVSAAQPLARSEGMTLLDSTARQVNMLKPQRSWLVPPAACAKICKQETK